MDLTYKEIRTGMLVYWNALDEKWNGVYRIKEIGRDDDAETTVKITFPFSKSDDYAEVWLFELDRLNTENCDVNELVRRERESHGIK